MARKREIECPPKEELETLRKAGKTRDEIALIYNVSLSRVKRWIKELSIDTDDAPRAANSPKARSKAEKRRALGDDDGLTLMEKARAILGKRVSEDYRGYLLDCRPVRVDVLVRAAGLTLPEVV